MSSTKFVFLRRLEKQEGSTLHSNSELELIKNKLSQVHVNLVHSNLLTLHGWHKF